jgi:uncharacterized protein YcbK (DUF882 family)
MKRYVIAAIAAFILPVILWAGHGFASGFSGGMGHEKSAPWTLSFYNTHTRDHLTVTYREGRGQMVEAAMSDVNYFLRDHRNGHVHEIDAGLLDLLHDLKTTLERRHAGLNVEYQVISGYRSRETNEKLRLAGGGQGKKSQHIEGKAIDIRVPGISTDELRNTAWCLQRGGVGYYKSSGFVHVDTGKIRYWQWKPAAGVCGGGSMFNS